MESKLNLKYKMNRGGYISNREPEFFSYVLSSIIYIINTVFTIYIISAITLYVIFHFLGKEFLTDENKSQVEVENKFPNNIWIMLVLMIIGHFSISGKSKSLFIGYTLGLMITNINYFFNFLPFNINYNTANTTIYTSHTIFNIIIILTNFAICAYSIYFYFLMIGYFKFDLNDVPLSQIIHEIRLRTDMLKINYNSFFVTVGIHKYLPGLLYKKEDFYFMTAESSRDSREEREIISSIKGKKNLNFTRNSENLNSKSTIDSSEYEPLK